MQVLDISPNSLHGRNSATDCQKKCQENKECNFWTWGMANHPQGEVQRICYLKKFKDIVMENKFTISGPKTCKGI